jgi:hypothetical protein
MSNSCYSETSSFNTQLAIDLKCVELALIVQFFINTISFHKRLGRNFINGKTWNYCTRKELCAYFPYWNEHEIKRKILKLVDMGILIKSCYNKNPIDKTCWYAFKDEEKYGISKVEKVPEKVEKVVEKDDNSKNVYERRNRPSRDEIVRPIPPIYSTDLKMHLKTNDSKESKGCSLDFKNKKESLKSMGKFQLTDVQIENLIWLESLGIDSPSHTLSWWAKNFTRERLEFVYLEAFRNNAKSLGAYMRSLLKAETSEDSENIEINRKTCRLFKEENQWGALKIKEKHAVIHVAHLQIELPFNIDPLEFYKRLLEKHSIYT